MRRTKTVSQRIRKRAKSSRSPNKSEARKIELDSSSSRSFADNNVEFVIFHSRVENLLNHFVQTMNFVYKQNIPIFKIRKNRTKIPDTFNGRPRGNFDTYSHFLRNNMGQGSFSKSSRSIEEDVINAFSSFFGSLNENIKIALDFFLTYILCKKLWTKGIIEVLFLAEICVGINHTGLK